MAGLAEFVGTQRHAMLQIYNSPSGQVEEGTSTRDVPSSAELSLADLFTKAIGFIRRRFLVILSVVPLTVGLAAVYIFTTPPLYSAHARIMIDTGKVQLFKQAILGDDPVNSAMVDSQLEILRSDNFLLSIVKNLRLTQDPEFVEPKAEPDWQCNRTRYCTDYTSCYTPLHQ